MDTSRILGIRGKSEPEKIFSLPLEEKALDKLSPAQFQDLVKELLIRRDFEVESTSLTRDGGVDAYACFYEKRIGKKFKIVIQVKHYSPSNKVGEPMVRDLIGAMKLESAERGLLITTSYFTRDAKDAAFKAGNVKLVDRKELVDWLKEANLLMDSLKLDSLLKLCAAQISNNTAMYRGNIEKLDKKFIPELYVARKDAESFVNSLTKLSRVFERNLDQYARELRKYERALLQHKKEKQSYEEELRKYQRMLPQYEKEKQSYERTWQLYMQKLERTRIDKARGKKRVIEPLPPKKPKEPKEPRMPTPPLKPKKPRTAHCTAIVGEAGIGKTNLFCKLSDNLSDSGNPVLFYAGHTLTTNLEDMIFCDLRPLITHKLEDNILLGHLNEMLRYHDKFLFIFIDAINESERYKHIGLEINSFLKKLESLDTTRIKLHVSCRDIEWPVITSANPDFVKNHILGSQPFYLQKFTKKELRLVWEAYKGPYQLKDVEFESLGKKIIDIIGQPLMLRFLCEAYKGDYVPRDIERLQIFEKYWERKFGEMERIGLQLGVEDMKNEATNFLFRIVDKMRELKQWELLEYNAEELTGQRARDYKSAFMRLLSEHIIIYSRIDKRIGARLIGFTYEAFFEYVLAKRIYIRNNWTQLPEDKILTKFKSLIDESNEYRSLKGALQYLVLFFEKEEEGNIHVKMLEELTKTQQGCEIAYETLARLKNVDVRIVRVLRQIMINSAGSLGARRWGRDQVAVEIFSNMPERVLSDVFDELNVWLSGTRKDISQAAIVGLTELVERRPEEALRLLRHAFTEEQFAWFGKSLIPLFRLTYSIVNDDTVAILLAMVRNSSAIIRSVPKQFVRKLSPHLKEKMFDYLPRLVQSREPAIRALAIDVLEEIGYRKPRLSLTILRDLCKKESNQTLRHKATELIGRMSDVPNI